MAGYENFGRTLSNNLKSHQKYTNLRTRHQAHYTRQIQEFNIFSDSQLWPENTIRQDIHFQLVEQDRDKLFQLTDDIFRVVRELKSKGLGYKLWSDSDGRDWRIISRNYVEIDKDK